MIFLPGAAVFFGGRGKMPWRWKKPWDKRTPFLVFRKRGQDFYVGRNDLLLLGGPGSGKTTEIEKLLVRLSEGGKKALFIPGLRPVSDWFRINNIGGKNNFEREEALASTPWDWILIDDADCLSRAKQEVLKRVIYPGGPPVVATASNFRNLPPFLQERLEKARELKLPGGGSGALDLTYTFVAIILLIAAAVGGGMHSFFLSLMAVRWLTRDA